MASDAQVTNVTTHAQRKLSRTMVLYPVLFLLGVGVAVLAGAGKRDAAAQAQGMTGPMSREAAVRLVRAVLQAHKITSSPGLNDKNLGGLDLGGQQLYFEYLPERKALRASALVYRFHKPPRPGVIEGFRHEEQSGTDAGGGTVDYQPESRGLYLSRTYTTQVPEAQFMKDMQRLVQASQRWGGEVLERVSARVFQGGLH